MIDGAMGQRGDRSVAIAWRIGITYMFWTSKISSLLYGLNLDELRSRTTPAAHPFLDAAAEVFSQSPDSQIEHWAHAIADASDRAVLNTIPLLSQSDRVVVSHLLSGASLTLENCQKLPTSSPVAPFPSTRERGELQMLPEKLFWWLWRCLPQAICQHLGREEAILLPASETLPDASVWSHASLAAAMAGALVGKPQRGTIPNDKLSARGESFLSCPHLAIFSFSPVQELIKASRKMRDFWAGSWILHYLSARVCWKLAQKYGPDCLIYPSLYQQPSIDHWLLQKWPDFAPWVEEPNDRALLTAGFPNVIVALLPEGEVEAAMQTARQTLVSEEWLQNLGGQVYEQLKARRWVGKLTPDNSTWNGWLKHQWQIYWTALPLGSRKLEEALCNAIA
ncbi:MAG: type III-B CRISPR-associated protein Cas10/Cmr2, partial [Cyanobacteriota bacterium]|nr:type III-B CRISPR-associated protein Cas10/Cmr2 [Cyanobacteriota bacterium]